MKNLGKFNFIDIHYHASPDLYERKLTAIAAGEIYHALGGAVVLKSHLGSTSIQATLAQSMGLPVFPSVILNKFAGGIDHHVVLRALADYQSSYPLKMLVDFPTITGRKFTSKLSRKLMHTTFSTATLAAETIFNEQGQIKSSAVDILKMARDYPIVLSTGHSSKEEIYALIDACYQHNVPGLLINQPAHPLTGLKAAELMELSTHDFLWMEQTLLTYLLGHQDIKDVKENLIHLPKVVYSSDLGQCTQIGVAEWVEYTERLFAELKLTAERRKEVELINPMKLLVT
jgi:integrase